MCKIVQSSFKKNIFPETKRHEKILLDNENTLDHSSRLGWFPRSFSHVLVIFYQCCIDPGAAASDKKKGNTFLKNIWSKQKVVKRAFYILYIIIYKETCRWRI